MSLTVFQVGLMSAGVIFLIGGAVLAVFAARIASRGRAAQAEADLRLAASQELATEVKRLAEKVELSLQARDNAIENAFMRHNDACAASMEATFGARKTAGHDHHAGDADGLKSRHAAADHHHDDDDDDHHKHHAGRSRDHEDGALEKSHSADEERPSFLARLFGRR